MNGPMETINHVTEISKTNSAFPKSHMILLYQGMAFHNVLHDYFDQLDFTRCGLVTTYGDIDLGQHWFKKCRVARQHQAITWSNVHQWGPVTFLWAPEDLCTLNIVYKMTAILFGDLGY